MSGKYSQTGTPSGQSRCGSIYDWICRGEWHSPFGCEVAILRRSVAKAKIVEDGCVITQELLKANAAKISNICQAFGVPYLNLEGFIEKEGWEF